jgi:hypothetical protein
VMIKTPLQKICFSGNLFDIKKFHMPSFKPHHIAIFTAALFFLSFAAGYILISNLNENTTFSQASSENFIGR